MAESKSVSNDLGHQPGLSGREPEGGQKVKARDYQGECVDSVFDYLFAQRKRSTIAVLATGLGKTIIIALVCKRWQFGRILLLAHRQELIDQGAEKITMVTGEPCG